MRTHGWGGDPPRTDDEAVARIIAAAKKVIDERGAKINLADVARELGVTRQTVYRYFVGTEQLLSATAIDATAEFMDAITDDLRGISDPGEAVVEGVSVVLERLESSDYVGLLVTGEGRSLPAMGSITAEPARHFARQMVGRLDVDWDSAGYGDDDLDDVVEIVLRTLQSMLLDPGSPPRTPEELRAFLRRWTAPAIGSLADRGRAVGVSEVRR